MGPGPRPEEVPGLPHVQGDLRVHGCRRRQGQERQGRQGRRPGQVAPGPPDPCTAVGPFTAVPTPEVRCGTPGGLLREQELTDGSDTRAAPGLRPSGPGFPLDSGTALRAAPGTGSTERWPRSTLGAVTSPTTRAGVSRSGADFERRMTVYYVLLDAVG